MVGHMERPGDRLGAGAVQIPAIKRQVVAAQVGRVRLIDAVARLQRRGIPLRIGRGRDIHRPIVICVTLGQEGHHKGSGQLAIRAVVALMDLILLVVLAVCGHEVEVPAGPFRRPLKQGQGQLERLDRREFERFCDFHLVPCRQVEAQFQGRLEQDFARQRNRVKHIDGIRRRGIQRRGDLHTQKQIDLNRLDDEDVRLNGDLKAEFELALGGELQIALGLALVIDGLLPIDAHGRRGVGEGVADLGRSGELDVQAVIQVHVHDAADRAHHHPAQRYLVSLTADTLILQLGILLHQLVHFVV